MRVLVIAPEARAARHANGGLRVVSPHGDFSIPVVTVQADALHEPFDLVLVATKSYALHEAMEQFAPAVGPATAILPILNGMAPSRRSKRATSPGSAAVARAAASNRSRSSASGRIAA